MNVILLDQAAIELSIRKARNFEGKFCVCSTGDLFLVLERFRKDKNAGNTKAEIVNGSTSFQQSCTQGTIMIMQLHRSVIATESFVDIYGDELNLDRNVFQSNAPEDSVRELNLKELKIWEWDIS